MKPEFNSEILINKIDLLCHQAGITKTNLFTDCGLNKNVISNLKNGSVPSVDKIAIIADYFNCSIDYLLGRSEMPNSQSITTGDINNNISGDNNSNHVNVGNNQLSDDTKTLVEMIQDLPLLERSKVVVMIDEMRKGA
ncbi:MAG: helix-turn-helix transcriptional regulator [Oscillospiraceae bacterium]|nr:helix-turn-helix transcriptional regulator [Oscillospiraceae bacterium]